MGSLPFPLPHRGEDDDTTSRRFQSNYYNNSQGSVLVLQFFCWGHLDSGVLFGLVTRLNSAHFSGGASWHGMDGFVLCCGEFCLLVSMEISNDVVQWTRKSHRWRSVYSAAFGSLYKGGEWRCSLLTTHLEMGRCLNSKRRTLWLVDYFLMISLPSRGTIWMDKGKWRELYEKGGKFRGCLWWFTFPAKS